MEQFYRSRNINDIPIELQTDETAQLIVDMIQIKSVSRCQRYHTIGPVRVKCRDLGIHFCKSNALMYQAEQDVIFYIPPNTNPINIHRGYPEILPVDKENDIISYYYVPYNYINDQCTYNGLIILPPTIMYDKEIRHHLKQCINPQKYNGIELDKCDKFRVYSDENLPNYITKETLLDYSRKYLENSIFDINDENSLFMHKIYKLMYIKSPNLSIKQIIERNNSRFSNIHRNPQPVNQYEPIPYITAMNKKYKETKEKETKEKETKETKTTETKKETDTNQSNECCICYDTIIKRKCIVPCGHTSVCEKCLNLMKKSNTCPMCRSDILMIIDIFN